MIKLLVFLLLGSLTALTAWLVHVPNSAQANDIPEKYVETVDKGLAFLAKSQLADGHWEGEGGKHPVAMTGLVGVALLMEMSLEEEDELQPARNGRKHAATVKKAADWLMKKIRPSGLILSDHPSESERYLDSHGLATLFLAGTFNQNRITLELAEGKSRYEVLRQAVEYIVKSQSGQGGWYHTSKSEGHDLDTISSTVIQLQALQAAQSANIAVPAYVINDAQQYLSMALDRSEAQNRVRPVEVAAALACRFCPGRREERKLDTQSSQRFKWCASKIPTDGNAKLCRDELAHYYHAQALYHRGDTWTEYRTAMFDHLQARQNKDGSWPGGSGSEEGIGGGALYSTALWCTVLQLDRKSHPCLPRTDYQVK